MLYSGLYQLARQKHYYLKLSVFIALMSSGTLFAAQPYQPPQLSESATLPTPITTITPKNIVGKTPDAALLNWIYDPDPSNICAGYYSEAPINFRSIIPDQTLALNADSIVLHENAPTLYLGNVHITQPGLQGTADKAVSYLDKHKKGISEIKAYGDVRVRQPGMLIVANKADLHVTAQSGTFYDAIYRLLRSSITPEGAISSTGTTTGTVLPNSLEYKVVGLSTHGSATVATQTEPQEYDLQNATYTSCAPGNNSWHLSAKKMQIDDKKKTIVAHDAYLNVAGVPILYTPYLDLSYDNTRKSGFLLPNPFFSYSSQSGFTYGQPFYWNIAPNYDDTITPTYYSMRGVLLQNTFNYLTWDTLGTFYFGIIPHDVVFSNFQTQAQQPGYNYNTAANMQGLHYASDARGYFSWQHQIYLNQYWLSQTNINYVTDDYYFQDFGNAPWQIAQSQLQQSSEIQYNGQNWSFLGLMENYQTLHPINTSTNYNDQYARWPELDWNGDYPNQWGGLGYAIQNQFVNFHQNLLPNHFAFNPPANGSTAPTVASQITGQRINIQPEISLPAYAPWGYIKPDVQFEETAYNLTNIPVNAWTVTTTPPNPASPAYYTPNSPSTISRALPIFDIDSGLYFDRNTNIGSQSYTTTFEPRLFYLYIPYVNQQNIPIFDTTESLFTYDTVFQTNRFDGIDRINNANQIGLGFTSHLINNYDGFDQLDFDTGQIYYFANRQVNLCPPNTLLTAQGCTPNANSTAPVSPIASDLNYHINNALTLTGSEAWNITYNTLQNGGINLAYNDSGKKIFNVGISYQRWDALDIGGMNTTGTNPDSSNIEQFSASTYWPINYHWAMLGALTYVLNSHFAQTYLAGVEYNTCCWAVRVVTARNFIMLNAQNNPTFDNEYYIQWVLKSFTSVAFNNASSLLQTNIPGFTDTLMKS